MLVVASVAAVAASHMVGAKQGGPGRPCAEEGVTPAQAVIGVVLVLLSQFVCARGSH